MTYINLPILYRPLMAVINYVGVYAPTSKFVHQKHLNLYALVA